MKYTEKHKRLVQKRNELLTELKGFIESEDDNPHREMFGGFDMNGELGYAFKFGEHHFAISGRIGIFINAIIFETWMYVEDKESIPSVKTGIHMKELDFIFENGAVRLVNAERHAYFEYDYVMNLLKSIEKFERSWLVMGV